VVTADLRQTALLVPIPEAERLASRLRRRFDPVALEGIPAHITLTVPFLPAARIDDRVLDDLRGLFSAVPTFAFRLQGLAGFRGVLWLAPDPAAPFLGLVQRLAERYPEAPPYGGLFDTVVPHQTLAMRDDPEALEAVARAVFTAPPLVAVARAVWLMEQGLDGFWETRARFPLGPPLAGGAGVDSAAR
jgi:hypothetical protein